MIAILMARFDPGTADPRLYDHLGAYPRELFSESFYRSCEVVDRYVLEWTVELAGVLDLAPALGGAGATPEAIVAARGWTAAFVPALAFVLARLAAERLLLQEADSGRYRLPAPLPAPDRADLRAQALELDPANRATLDLLDAAAAAYPAVARGERSGEEALFGQGQSELWRAYFDNRNRLYAINNEIAAIAAADRLPAGRFRVLEIGAGGASGTVALLAELERRGRLGDLERYLATDLSPFLRRHGERTVRARWTGLPVSFATLDVDRPWSEQGVEPGSVDLVYGVNVLHVARDLASTLHEARGALAPDAWLVAGECVRPFRGQPVWAELVFSLLASFTRVELDPVLRPNHGFLSPRPWRASLRAAGFDPVLLTPDVEAVREIYPRFFTAAVFGRRGRSGQRPD